MRQVRFPGKVRWAVPAAAVAAAGLVIAGSMLASAQAAPVLPARSAAQLLADVAQSATVPSSLSGVISESASLGLPELPAAGGSSSGYSQLAGTHSFSFWYAGPEHVRIAIPVQLGETDLRQDGRQVWLWDSTTNTATHVLLQAGAGRAAAALPLPAGSGDVAVAPTPQEAARQVLAAVGPTTTVSVQQNVMVAGQAAYQLSIAPKSGGSLVGQIRIAIDSRGYLPLRLQVFARGATSPAYQIGFSSLSFARPAASNFAFTPPPGAKVKTVKVPANAASLLPGLRGSLAQGAGVSGSALPVPLPAPGAVQSPGSKQQLKLLPKGWLTERRMLLKGLPKGLTAAQRKAMLRSMRKMVLATPANGQQASTSLQVQAPSVLPASALPGALPPGALGALLRGDLGGLPQGAAPTVIGTGWLSVIMLRADPSSLAALEGTASPSSGTVSSSSAQNSSAAGSSAVAYSSTLMISGGPAGPDLAVLRALLRAATPVHGSWGSGRLLRTALVSALFTSNGRVLIGAVTPSVLYTDAAKAK